MPKYRLKVLGMLVALLTTSSITSPALAQSTEERLKELEEFYVELLIRDREKQQEIEHLRRELERVREGDRTAGPTTKMSEDHDHGHGHDHGGQHHDHGDHDDHGHHHGHSNGYGSVILETDELVVYSPAIGIDTSFYQDDGDTALESRLEDLAGFGGGHGHEHDHGGEEGGHSHGHGLEDGFNLRHAEVGLALGLKGVGRAQVLFNGSEDGVETEEAFFVSEPLADTFTLKAGIFRSGFGFFNQRHSPGWDFIDQPLANYAILGDHGLEGLGGQLVITPGNGRLTLGLEAFNGDAETLFSRVDEIEDQDRPGVGVAWVKGDVFRSAQSRLRLGLAGGYGIHQQSLGSEEHHDHDEDGHHDHDEDEHDEGESERLGDGHAWFISPGFEYSHEGSGHRFEGDWLLRGEYLYRFKDLDIVGETSEFEAEQDGYYLEALYGFTPSLQLGARFDQVGLTNSVTDEGTETNFDSSYRTSLVGSYWPRDWARLSFQIGYGEYAFEEEDDEVLSGSIRFTMQLGPHFH